MHTFHGIYRDEHIEGKSNSGAYDNIYDNKKWYHDNETFYHDKNTSYDQFMIQKYKPW